MAINGILQQGERRNRLPRPLWQAALLLLPATAACGQATSSNAQTTPPPFTVQEVAKFSTPWAMDFLPGSGVSLTRHALVSEKEGKLWLVDTATGSRRSPGFLRPMSRGKAGLAMSWSIRALPAISGSI